MTRLLTAIVAAACLVAAHGSEPAGAAPAARSESDVLDLATFEPITDTRSALTRTDRGVSFTISTTGLAEGDAVTVWWVVFNHPDNCTAPCGPDDLFRAGVDASVLYAAGNVVGGSGRSSFAGRLNAGDVSGTLFGPGLVRPRDAEIHFVVRTHGPAIPGTVDSQIHSFGGGCHNVDDGTPMRGEPGPNTCADVQAAIHQS